MAKARVVTGKKVRYAVVGLGWISQAEFMPGVAHTGNSEMVALVTGHEEKAQKVGEKYGIETVYTYDQYDAMLASGEVDAVYLATPNFDHVEYAVKTLDAGIHLLLEKPMAVSVEECERIIAASERTGAKLMIAYRLHHEPGTLRAIERVRAGELGTIRAFSSMFSQKVAKSNHRANNGFWAGPVADMGPYPINAVRNLFGAEPVEVFAMGTQTDPEKFDFDDTVAVTLRFAGHGSGGGRLSTFVLAYNGGDVDEYRILGDKGDLRSEPAYQVGMAIKHEVRIEKKESEDNFKATDHFGGELKYFSECILEDRQPEADGVEGMLDVWIIEAIEESLNTGQVVRLEPMQRTRRPVEKEQAEKLGTVKEPELVGAKKPSEA